MVYLLQGDKLMTYVMADVYGYRENYMDFMNCVNFSDNDVMDMIHQSKV